MKEAFEKIKERLEEERYKNSMCKEFRLSGTESYYEAKYEAKAYEEAIEIVNQAAEECNNGWIPFTFREADAEEKEVFEWDKVLDCKLPEEDEEILVTYKFKDEFYVDTDIFLRDGSGCYLESGRDFVEDAVAWRPYPTPYKPKGDAE